MYRHVGAGGTVMRPTKEGPAMIFENVKGHPGAKVAIGLLASRKRVAALLDTRPEDLDFDLNKLVPAPTNTPDDAAPTSLWVCVMLPTRTQG